MTTIAVYFAPMTSRFTDDQVELWRGKNNYLSVDNIDSFFLFEELNDVDISVIYGIYSPEAVLLLLFRCHYRNSKNIFIEGNTKIRKLLNDLTDCLQQPDKFERRRVGGSSGCMSYTSIKTLMDIKNSSPRIARGSIFVLQKNCLTVKVYWISPYDLKPKQCYYSNPVKGGKFCMTNEFLDKYQTFLYPFLGSKIYASLILNKIPSLLSTKFDSLAKSVNPRAVEHELYCHKTTLRFTNDFFFKRLHETCGIKAHDYRFKNYDGKKVRQDIAKILKQCNHYFYAFLASTFLNFTLVQHAVKFHLDYFADGLESLENRIVFGFDSSDSDVDKHGRGGMPNKYCFAILDWSSKGREDVKLWCHEAYQHLPHARKNFGPNQTFTPAIKNAFLSELRNDPKYISRQKSKRN